MDIQIRPRSSGGASQSGSAAAGGGIDDFDKYLASDVLDGEEALRNLDYSEPSFTKDSSFKVGNMSGISEAEDREEQSENASTLEAKMERLDGLLQENNQDVSTFAAVSKQSAGSDEGSSLSSSNLQERFERLDNLLSSGLNDSSKLEFQGSPQPETPEQGVTKYITSSQQKHDLHNVTASTTEGNSKSWSQVNRMLESAGFSGVRVSDDAGPDPESVLIQLRDVISQYEKRGEMIQEMMLQQRNSTENERSGSVDSLKRKVERLSVENEQLKRQVQEKQDESISLKEKETEAKSKRLEVENANLQQKLRHVEHKVKAKESLVDKFKRKLAVEEERHHSRAAKSQEIFKGIEQRLPKQNSATDQKILQVIQHFQSEQSRLEQELEEQKRHVRSLAKTVVDSDNAQMSVMQKTEPPSQVSSIDLEEASALKKQEETLLAKVAQLETRLKAQMAANDELSEKVDSFKLELASRPTIRDWRELQEERAGLEQKLRGAEETVERLELKENNIYVPMKDKNARFKDTRALMHEDKLNHKLGLSSATFQNMQQSVAIETVRSLCRILTLSDPELLVPAVQKLIWVVQAMPKLEAFAKKVSRFVALNAPSEEVAAALDKDPLAPLLPQIKAWARDARRVRSFDKLRRKLSEMLLSDGELSLENRDLDKVDDAEILRVVADLIRMKQSLLGQEAVFAKAGIRLEAGAEELLSQIVKHFQQIFEVKTVQGVLPKMNEIYVFVNEMENFIKILRPMLGLSPKASLHSIITAIETQLLETQPTATVPEKLDDSFPRYEPTWR